MMKLITIVIIILMAFAVIVMLLIIKDRNNLLAAEQLAAGHLRNEVFLLKNRMVSYDDGFKDRMVNFIYNRTTRISRETCQMIVTESMKYDHPILLLALIGIESEYYPWAVSSKGAKGLGQIMFKYHGKKLVEVGIIREERDLFNIRENINATSFILNNYLKINSNNPIKALESYVGGREKKYVQDITVNFFLLSLLQKTKEGG